MVTNNDATSSRVAAAAAALPVDVNAQRNNAGEDRPVGDFLSYGALVSRKISTHL
jgi:hypothetical protein